MKTGSFYIAGRLRAGQVHLNYAGCDMRTPFGDYRQYGNGREYAEWGLREFLEVKALVGYGPTTPTQPDVRNTRTTDLSKVSVNRHFGETAFADSTLRNGEIT